MSDRLKQAALKLAKKDPVFRRALVAAMTDGSVRAFLVTGQRPSITRKADVDGNYMSRQALRKVATQAAELLQMLPQNMPMEDWMESKITRASNEISGVYDYMKYRDYEGVKMSSK